MNGINQNEWDTILADSTFQEQPFEIKRKVAENFFNKNILSDPSFQRQQENIRNQVYNNFFKTIGEPTEAIPKPKMELGKIIEPVLRPLTTIPTKIVDAIIPADPSDKDLNEAFKFKGVPTILSLLPISAKRKIYNTARGLSVGIGETEEGLTSPLNIGLIVTGGVLGKASITAGRVIAGLFSASMASAVPGEFKEFTNAIKSGNEEEIARTGVRMVASLFFVFGAGKHAIRGRRVKPIDVEKRIEKEVIIPEVKKEIPVEKKPPKVPVGKPPEAELKIPEVKKPYPTTAMFDTKDIRTGETIKATESVWFYPELGGVVKESTHRKLFQKIQVPGKILEKEEFRIKEVPKRQKEIFKKPTIFKEYKKYERDIDIIRSEIERGEPAKKIISGGRMINGVERVVTWQPSTYPEYFRDKGYTKKEVLNIIDKIKAGKPITEIQTTIINDLIKSKRDIDVRILKKVRYERAPVVRDIVIPEQGIEKVPVSEGIKVPLESREVPKEIYKRVVEKKKKPLFGLRLNKKYKSAKGGIATDIFVPISTRLERINPVIKSALRKHTFDLGMRKARDTRNAIPFMEVTKRMNTADKVTLDLAQKNSDWNKINEIVKKYGAEKELAQLRTMFDDIYKRAKAVNFDVEYLKNYFPRTIRDKQGLLNYLYETKDWGRISENIKLKEKELGRVLNIEEKAYIADNVIRGYGARKLAVGKPGYLKGRKINIIDETLNEFYYDTNTSTLKYIERVNNAIEVRKFFGKGKPQKLTMFEEIDPTEIDRSIGDYAAKLVEERKISQQQENELITILRSRFGYRHSRGSIAAMKNIAYMTSLNNVYNAITQFGDLAWSYYTVGPVITTKHAIKSVFGKADIKKSDVGITRIAQEFSSMSKLGKALEGTFKWIGLEKIDRIGKEALMSGVVDKIRKQAKKDKINPYFRKKLEATFGDKTDQVIKEIKSGELTENVKLFAFNILNDFQPITLDEMPKFYLDSPNGRIFYMLKTFTIKQFDIARRESLSLIKNGKTSKERALGVARGLRLAAVFILCNATADEIKNYLLGRDETFSDKVWDNVLRLFGLSRFVAFNIERYGITDTIYKLASMPLNIIELPYKDVSRAIKAYGRRGRLEDIKIKDLETWKIIPFFGKQYYFWFGRGKEMEEKYSKQRRRAK